MIGYLYDVLMLVCAVYVGLRGKRDHWIAMGGLVLGSLATLLVYKFSSSRWAQMETGVLLVDLAYLALLFTLAVRSKQFWPLWVAAFQLVGTLTHLARLVSPNILPYGYGMAQGMWAYLQMAAIVYPVFVMNRTSKKT